MPVVYPTPRTVSCLCDVMELARAYGVDLSFDDACCIVIRLLGDEQVDKDCRNTAVP